MGPSVSPKSQALGSVAHVYDPATDSFRQVGKMNSPRVGAASITLPNGMTLIAGGGRCVDGQSGIRSCFGDQYRAVVRSQDAQIYCRRHRQQRPDERGEDGHNATFISGCNCPLEGDVLLAGGNGGLESVSPDRAASDAPPLNARSFTTIGQTRSSRSRIR
jgi:hypothetical protein